MLKVVLLCSSILKYVKLSTKSELVYVRENLHKHKYESLVSTD